MLGGWMASVLGLYTGSSMGVFLVALVGAVVRRLEDWLEWRFEGDEDPFRGTRAGAA